MQTDFLNKLYEIKPFKIVNSPESMKNQSFKHSSSEKGISKLQGPNNETPSKCPQQPFIKISDSNLFSNLSQSIDNLFSKIQKIKMEFDCSEQSPNRHGSNHSSINKSQKSKKKSSFYHKQNLPEKQSHGNKKGSSFKKAISSNQYTCSPFLDDYSAVQVNKKCSQFPQTSHIEPLHKTKSLFEKYQLPNFYQQNSQSSNISETLLSMKNFQLGKCVGSGKFGDVHICRHKPTNSLFALKKIFKSTIKQYNMVNQFIKQLKIHYFLNHPSIVKLYAFFQDDYHVFLLMEYAEDGTLYDKFIKKSSNRQAPRQDLISQQILQVLNSVSYLHRNNILHRDIKPENIVITNGNYIKLCDFGWSAIFDNQMKKTFCGTLDYLSPEMKDKGEYTTSVDLWSIGVLTFELLAGFAPFKSEIDKMKWKGAKNGEDQIKGNKWSWDKINFPQNFSAEAKDFIQGLLQEDPNQRPSIRQCLRHPFIQKYSKSMGSLQNQLIEKQVSQIL